MWLYITVYLLFFLNFGPAFENCESSSSWVGVYYFLRRDSHTLSEYLTTIFFLSMLGLSQFHLQSFSSFPSTRNINTRSLFSITLEHRNSPLLAQSQCHVIANQHKWCPVLNGFEKFRLPHPFHGLMEGHTCALPCRQMFIKDFHERQNSLVVN